MSTCVNIQVNAQKQNHNIPQHKSAQSISLCAYVPLSMTTMLPLSMLVPLSSSPTCCGFCRLRQHHTSPMHAAIHRVFLQQGTETPASHGLKH